MDEILRAPEENTQIAIISHGGVGTLLLCHLKAALSNPGRAEDQPGQGHYFVFDSTGRVTQGWERIEGPPEKNNP